MAPKIDPISTINPSKETWNVVAKVQRLWLSPSLYGSKLPFCMDMVLVDSNGDKIHATVRKTLIYRFQSLLTEGRVYQISFFGVCESGRDFRTTTHPYKINFQIHTSIRVVPNITININPYTFMPISEIMFNEPDASFFIDVIGILTGASGEQEFEKDGVKQKKITLELDQDGSFGMCFLWEIYVAEIMGHLSSGDMTNVVVVVHYAKIKSFRVKSGIQNVYGATKVFFNPAIEEATQIRQRFFERNDAASQVLSQLQDSGKISLEEDLLRQTDRKTIEQIKDIAEKSYCVVLGTVKYIPDAMDWYYPACKCSKKVYPADGMYLCEACNRHVSVPTYKFRIQLRVMDSKDSATFVLFDQEASTLLNKTCVELVDASNKAGPDSPNIPFDILELVDRTFLFKIEVSNSWKSMYEPSYRIKKITSDPEIISQFVANFPPSETLHSEIVDAVASPSVEPISSNGDETSPAEMSPPSKRSSPDIDVQSYSRGSKKVIKAIKKEIF
ncbi:hypothetical protein OROGR_028136 [Orobanche gracilis]